jgi:hypothetical protein
MELITMFIASFFLLPIESLTYKELVPIQKKPLPVKTESHIDHDSLVLLQRSKTSKDLQPPMKRFKVDSCNDIANKGIENSFRVRNAALLVLVRFTFL